MHSYLILAPEFNSTLIHSTEHKPQLYIKPRPQFLSIKSPLPKQIIELVQFFTSHTLDNYLSIKASHIPNQPSRAAHQHEFC